MKKIITLLLIAFSNVVFGQGAPAIPAVTKAFIAHPQAKQMKKDTVIESDTSKENKEPRYFYLGTSTNIFVNTKGGFAARFAPSFEFGRTYGIFDIGVAAGQFSSLSSAVDTSRFVELRPTINIFSKGRFAEALCLGAGKVFGAKQALVTEICNSINFNISETIAIAVLQGYYFFDGTNSSRNTQYMGLNLTYNLLKNHSVNKRPKRDAIISDK